MGFQSAENIKFVDTAISEPLKHVKDTPVHMTTLHAGYNEQGESIGPVHNFQCDEKSNFLIGNIDLTPSRDKLGYEINPNKLRPDSCSIQPVGSYFSSFPWGNQADYGKYHAALDPY